MRFSYKTNFFSLTIVLIVGIVSLRPGGILAATEVGHFVMHIVSMDSFSVEVGPGLVSDKIDIFWSGDSLEPMPLRVIHKGIRDQAFPSVYGRNRFVVHYDGKPIPERFVQKKFADWHYHSYRFQVSSSESGGLVASASAFGPDIIILDRNP